MDSISPPPPSSAVRPDVVSVETAARPTPRTVGAPFSEVLAGGARAFVRGATAWDPLESTCRHASLSIL